MTFSAPSPIRAVVFDFGGVLFDWNPQHLYQQLIADEQQRNHFLTHICSPDWNVQQDGGRTLADGTADLVRQHPEYEALIRAFYGRWTEMLRGPLPEGVALLRELHAQQVPVFGLTNWSSETYPHARDHHDFMQLFLDIVVSGEERCIKPEPRIYQIALERYARHLPGLKPEELVFIDDVQKNIDGCRALGWRGIHHVDVTATRAALRALGVPCQL
ncbi:HAD family phosphatase [Herbaspirillum sp. 1130]|uniref:HAD family hydrolase n=1 Tax=Herbaspirillum sp. 1130 TaxID=2806562 RepID=UPI001AE9DB01|nr:HAD family phosphatase [Herbaspirillum sp. 1130]MBP1317182.1 2-haloacid dehalogenase [Herbaspirillum sp. 1130]